MKPIMQKSLLCAVLALSVVVVSVATVSYESSVNHTSAVDGTAMIVWKS
jgi:hypothetical protein